MTDNSAFRVQRAVTAQQNELDRLRASNAALLAACQLYMQTYVRTQTNPTPSQETKVISAMDAAIAQAEEKP